MPDIVNGLLLRNAHVLMAQRSASRRNYPATWSFPGGHVENGETLEAALIRELTEEIGVAPTASNYLHCFDDLSQTPSKPVTFHFFVVRAWRGDPQNLGDEHSTLRWVKLADASKMPRLAFTEYSDLFARLLAG